MIGSVFYTFAAENGVLQPVTVNAKKLTETLYAQHTQGKILAKGVKHIVDCPDWKSVPHLRDTVNASLKIFQSKKSAFKKKYVKIFEALQKSVDKVVRNTPSSSGAQDSKKADEAVARIDKLKEIKELGLKKEEIKQLVGFIQHKLPTLPSGAVYCKRKKFSLPRTVERTADGSVYIHLKKHKIDLLGKGYQKVASLSILFHAQSPKLIANCICDASLRHELDLQLKVKGLENVASPLSHGNHMKEKTGKDRLSLLFPLYDRGSLHGYIEKSRSSKKDLSFQKKLSIAHDAFKGARSLHAKGYIHRDLHVGNILVKSNKNATGRVEAAISDFGGLMKTEEYKVDKAPLQFVEPYIPPEFFLKNVKDPSKGDVYALGIGLLYMFAPKKFETIRALSKEACAIKAPGTPHTEAYAQALTSALQKICSGLEKKALKRTKKKESHAALTFQAIRRAIHPDPNIRISSNMGYDLLKKAKAAM